MHDTHSTPTEVEQRSDDAARSLVNAIIKLDDRLQADPPELASDFAYVWANEVHPLVEDVVQARAAHISELLDGVTSAADELVEVTAELDELVELSRGTFDRVLDVILTAAAVVGAVALWRRP